MTHRQSNAAGRNVETSLIVVLCLWACLCVGRQCLAQVDQGTITGVVQDKSGEVIPSAQVKLTNLDTGLVLQTKSDGSGVYVFSPIKIGNYEVTATSPGFQTTTRQNIHLDVQQRLNVMLQLDPGNVSQTVTVSTAPPLLQTQEASVGQVISTQTINDTPLNGRNWVYIAQLTAGVDPSNGSRGGGKGDFEANGQRAEQNNFVLDGVDNNINVIDFLNGASFVVRPPPDALAEFKIETSDYSAEFGHSAGAVLNASIKSGTNEIHGDLWEYFRNNVLDARDFSALTIPKYRENQFGATLGFPILKNRLFFFGDVEANRIIFGQPYTESVPTAKMRGGDFSELLNPNLSGAPQPIQLYQPNSGGTATLACNGQNNVFCTQQIDVVAQRLLNLYPSPNTNAGAIYNNYQINTTSYDNTFQWDVRMDWNISSKDQIFARFSYSHEPGYQAPPLGPTLDGGNYAADGTQINLAENFAGSETHIFNSSLTNELRFGFSYGHFGYLQPGYNQDVAGPLGLGGIPQNDYGFVLNGGLPNVTVSGISTFGAPAFYAVDEHQDVYQILDNVTKIIGNHSLKVGVDFQSIRNDFVVPTYPRGEYYFNGLYTSDPQASVQTGSGVADFLADQINSGAISNQAKTADARWYRAAYVQDDWRVNPRLTVNLGFRYDYYQPNKEIGGRQATYHVTGPIGPGFGAGVFQLPAQERNVPLVPLFTQTLALDNIALQYLDNERLVNAQFTNFAPRIGFAYQVDPLTVIRGGFGIFYGGLESVGATPNLGDNYPFQFSDNFNAPNCNAGYGNCPSSGLTLETGFSDVLAAGIQNFISVPSLTGSDPNLKTPYTVSYNLTVERSLTNNLVASMGYVGNEARHLGEYPDPNNPAALLNPANNAQAVRPFPDFGATTYTAYTGVSTYNSLQTKLEKRFSSGLSFLATYTWSHALDDAPTPLGSNGDPYFRNSTLIPIINDYSNSPWDTRQRFTLNGYYQLPFGVGKAHLNRRGVANEIAGGWAANLTFVAQTGQPFTVYPDIPTAAGGTANAILIRDPFIPGGVPDPSNPGVTCAAHTRNKTNWYNPCAFANPLPGANIPISGPGSEVTSFSQALAYLGGRRLSVFGPGYERINLSVFKNFDTFHGQYLQFRTDIFNVLNTPAYGNPSVTDDSSNGGQITSARFFQNFTPDARFFQLSLKYMF